MNFFDYLFPVKLSDLEKLQIQYEKKDGIHSFLLAFKKKKP
jgi:hypothetical protein